MANTSIDLEQILKVVDAQDPDASALERVTLARAVAVRLEALGQHTVAHFVQEARDAGASWTDIGGALGVTRQAAQQRFVPVGGVSVDTAKASLSIPLSGRADTALTAARDLAVEHHHRTTEDVHLLIGLLENRAAQAIQAVKAAGKRAADVRKAARARLGADGPRRSPSDPPLGRSAAKVLDRAVREALRFGKEEVGTADLLLAVAAEPQSPGGQALSDCGIAYLELRGLAPEGGWAGPTARKR